MRSTSIDHALFHLDRARGTSIILSLMITFPALSHDVPVSKNP